MLRRVSWVRRCWRASSWVVRRARTPRTPGELRARAAKVAQAPQAAKAAPGALARSSASSNTRAPWTSRRASLKTTFDAGRSPRCKTERTPRAPPSRSSSVSCLRGSNPQRAIRSSTSPCGPGSPALEEFFALDALDLLKTVNETRDLVYFDPRGTGISTPDLRCPERLARANEAYFAPGGSEEDGAARRAGMRACYDRLIADGLDLSHYHSASISADLAAGLEALGYESANFWATSYGGRVVQTFMREYPELTRSVVLDAPAMPDIRSTEASDFKRSFDTLLEDCAESATCSSTYPNLESELYSVVDSLNANPVPVDVEFQGETVTVYVSGDRFIAGLQNAFNSNVLNALSPTRHQQYVQRQLWDRSNGRAGPSVRVRHDFLGPWGLGRLCGECAVLDRGGARRKQPGRRLPNRRRHRPHLARRRRRHLRFLGGGTEARHRRRTRHQRHPDAHSPRRLRLGDPHELLRARRREPFEQPVRPLPNLWPRRPRTRLQCGGHHVRAAHPQRVPQRPDIPSGRHVCRGNPDPFLVFGAHAET